MEEYIKWLSEDDKNDLILFCLECKRLNYINNSSLEAMKYDTAEWVGTYKDGLLISVSGVRYEPNIAKDAYRVMFRGCTLPGHVRKISRNIERSSYNWQHIELQIKKIKTLIAPYSCSFYMTSNIEGGAKSHRLSNFMHNCKSVEYQGTRKLFGVEQKIWKLIN